MEIFQLRKNFIHVLEEIIKTNDKINHNILTQVANCVTVNEMRSILEQVLVINFHEGKVFINKTIYVMFMIYLFRIRKNIESIGKLIKCSFSMD